MGYLARVLYEWMIIFGEHKSIRQRSWPILSYPGIGPRRLVTKFIRQDNMCSVWDSNHKHSQYTPEALPPFPSVRYLQIINTKWKKTDECSDLSIYLERKTKRKNVNKLAPTFFFYKINCRTKQDKYQELSNYPTLLFPSVLQIFRISFSYFSSISLAFCSVISFSLSYYHQT